MDPSLKYFIILLIDTSLIKYSLLCRHISTSGRGNAIRYYSRVVPEKGPLNGCVCLCGNYQRVWSLGVCTERAVGGLRHPQSAVPTPPRRHVSVLPARHLRSHPTQDDLPSRPRAAHHPAD